MNSTERFVCSLLCPILPCLWLQSGMNVDSPPGNELWKLREGGFLLIVDKKCLRLESIFDLLYSPILLICLWWTCNGYFSLIISWNVPFGHTFVIIKYLKCYGQIYVHLLLNTESPVASVFNPVNTLDWSESMYFPLVPPWGQTFIVARVVKE